MGNRDHGFAGGECLQGELNLLLRFGIESRGGFIEKKDGGVLQNRAGDGDPLLLTPGKQHSLVADDSIVLVRLLQDELMRVGHLRRGVNFFACRVESAKKDIVVDSIVKQKRVLSHQPDLLTQRLLG